MLLCHFLKGNNMNLLLPNCSDLVSTRASLPANDFPLSFHTDISRGNMQHILLTDKWFLLNWLLSFIQFP